MTEIGRSVEQQEKEVSGQKEALENSEGTNSCRQQLGSEAAKWRKVADRRRIWAGTAAKGRRELAASRID
jgi:hypothetical protein